MFTVPKRVKQIKVDALGGNGGSSDESFPTGPVGYGGRVVATINVAPQEQLLVYVGGNGSADRQNAQRSNSDYLLTAIPCAEHSQSIVVVGPLAPGATSDAVPTPLA